MSLAIHDFLTPGEVVVEDPQDYVHIIDELRDTGEQLRVREKDVTDEECEALALAALFLLDSPVEGDMNAVLAAATVVAVTGDPRCEEAYERLRDAAFPISEELPAIEVLANERSREEFDLAIETTSPERSFGEALTRAGALSDIEGGFTDAALLEAWEAVEEQRAEEVKAGTTGMYQAQVPATTTKNPGDHGLFGGPELFSNYDQAVVATRIDKSSEHQNAA